MKPKENVLMSRITFSCVSKDITSVALCLNSLTQIKSAVGNRVQIHC